MNIEEAIRFFYQRINYENFTQLPYGELKKNLDKMSRFLRFSGSPDQACPLIHVAGSKGKGSLCATLDAIFSCSGYTVGRFTSPHLNSIHERFLVNGVPCSDEQFIEITSRLMEKLDTWPEKDTFTFFELTTLFAFEYFASQKTDMAILEVGLGGRCDATNICQPVLSLITSISLEHTELLGNDLASIASEKAGIIKKGVPVVSGVTWEDSGKAAEVIRKTAQERDAPLLSLQSDFFITNNKNVTFDYVWEKQKLKDITLSLWGEHQQRNASLAITAALIFQKWQWNISENAIREALQTISIPARIEKISENPLIIIDGAHNPDSVSVLVKTLQEYFGSRKKRLLFGANQDKDVRSMLEILVPCFEEIVMTQSRESLRAMSAEKLQVFNPDSRFFADPEQGIRYLLGKSEPNDLICVAGSFYLAGEMRRFFLENLRITFS